MSRKDQADALSGFLALFGVFALLVGYALNVAAVFNALGQPFTGGVLARVAGIFVAPLGGVLGWI